MKAPERQVTDAILGLDFGTGSTKVVIRLPYVASEPAWAVPVAAPRGARAVEARAFLAPMAMEADRNGALRLARVCEAGWRSLKVDLMENPGDAVVRARAVAYLALVGRVARRWLERAEPDLARRFQLRWTWNLGIPSNGWGAEDELYEAYRAVRRAAQKLAGCREAITLERASSVLKRLRDPEEGGAVIPEVVAEAIGYARSRDREEGLHFLVDVGATTVDVCAFLLREHEGSDNYAILTALVERRGAHKLHQGRLRWLDGLEITDVRRGIRDLDLGDPLAEVPGAISEYIARGNPEDRSQAEQFDQDWADRCAAQLVRCIRHVKQRRYPTAREWESELTVLLCGGGARCQLYERAVAEAERRARDAGWIRGHIRSQWIEAPARLQPRGLDGAVFPRLAVAYGLAFERFELGEVQSPDDIPDMEPLRRRRAPEPVTKDQV